MHDVKDVEKHDWSKITHKLIGNIRLGYGFITKIIVKYVLILLNQALV